MDTGSVLIVIDQHYAVARGDPQYGEKSDERTEGDYAASYIRRQQSAHQGRWQGDEGQDRQTPAPEGRHQEEENPDRSSNPKEDQAVLGSLPLRELS